MGNERNQAMTESVFYILLSLFNPLHGYGIMQNVKNLTNGRVTLGAGTLYGAINTLLAKNFIRECATFDASKKDYIITDEGIAALKRELNRLKELVDNGEKILEESHEG